MSASTAVKSVTSPDRAVVGGVIAAFGIMAAIVYVSRKFVPTTSLTAPVKEVIETVAP